jgi:ferrochelatase
MTEKLAVVLLNLGGPADAAALRPFLYSLFSDKNVVTLPQPFRFLLAAWIAGTRSRGSGKKAYAPLGGESPLLENTIAQAQALEKELQKNNPSARVFVSMRHSPPRADEVVKDVAAFQPDKIILLPLYPQYSTTSTFSALQDWRRAARLAGLSVPQKAVCCYPLNAGFIAASAALIQENLKQAPKRARLLFSAHSLPEKIVRAGDPYQKQCEQTAAAIIQQLNMPALDWQLCYQSRIGRIKWIDPSIGEALEKAADDKVGVIVYPLAFVSEHVETLVELDIKYRQRAESMGIRPYLRVPTVGVHPRFIEGLRDLVQGVMTGPGGSRNCPESFSKCCRPKETNREINKEK